MGKSNGVDQLAEAARALQEAGETGIAIVALGFGSERARLEQRVREPGLDNLLVPPPVAREELAGIVARRRRDADDLRALQDAPDELAEQVLRLPRGRHAGDHEPRRLAPRPRRGNNAGAYVPAGDGTALAEALVSLARRPDLAELGRNARALAEREFARDLLAERLRKTLEDSVRRAAARKPR